MKCWVLHVYKDKGPKIWCVQISDKMQRAVWSGSTLFAIPFKLDKKQNLGRKSME